ncbi:MAG: branched-chain amino acid ABC transporter permease [Bacteriovoracales bacterium]|nr:branched-chain amino acid ABC transporter permease [Bacteriovoracales bacterium]
MSESTTLFLYDLATYLLNGITQGSVYALIALGYTMVYGIIQLINFAHGEFYMMGAFIGFFALVSGVPIWLALPASMLGAGLLAMVTERLVYRPLRNAGRIPALVTALGMSLFFQYAGQALLGATPRSFPQVIPTKTYQWGELYVTNIQLLIIFCTFVLMVFLWWLVNKTRVGKAMRATSFNHHVAELMGIDTNKIIGLTFFIGGAFAGVAGILVGMYYNTIDPTMGMIPGIKAFVAAVLGGIGIIPGAVLGGLVLGVAENLVVGLWVSTYRDAIAFAILILILLFKPAGLLGSPKREKI